MQPITHQAAPPVALQPGATVRPTRMAEVEGRPVHIYDGLLPEVEPYVEALERSAFTRTEVARPDTAQFRHWVCELPLQQLVQDPIFAVTSQVVQGYCAPGFAYRAYRSYTNIAFHGDMLFTHFDCPPEHRHLTALWYFARRWDVEWGGETLFFDAHGDARAVASPVPGWLVVFDGGIRHVGRPPNRICHEPRYSFAIKFEPVRVPAATGR